MKGKSFLWVAPSENAVTGGLPLMHTAGLMPVRVHSTDVALHLLQQFQVGVVVVHVRDSHDGWRECAQLAAAGPPVAAIVHSFDGEVARQYLLAGCAAVLDDSCPCSELVTVLERIAAGQRGIVWSGRDGPDMASC